MSHQRIANKPVAAGDDLDQAEVLDLYRCDGCQQVREPGELYRVQGQVFKYGASTGYLAADICETCAKARPVGEFFQGMS